jgi:hypothetical protein
MVPLPNQLAGDVRTIMYLDDVEQVANIFNAMQVKIRIVFFVQRRSVSDHGLQATTIGFISRRYMALDLFF